MRTLSPLFPESSRLHPCLIGSGRGLVPSPRFHVHLTFCHSFARIAARGCRRRTFAIISHPDAGKTTLTEKFLLYGGAIQLAGSVTARKNQRATHLRLDGAGEAARHLRQLDRAAVRLPATA